MQEPKNKIQQAFNIFRIFCFHLTSLLVFLLITSSISKAQIELSQFDGFKHYTEEDGLASKYISDIKEDKHGFIWLASAKGITRYDGVQFTNFTQYGDSSGQHSIGFVTSFEIDKTGENLWIACNSGILHTPIDDIKFQKLEGNLSSLKNSTENVIDLYLQNNNQLWSANNNTGLHLYNLSSDGSG